jgi:hypothetical protein
MAIPIKIKRKDESQTTDGGPGSLLQGELAFNEYDQVMYYGRGATPSVVSIGGPGYLTRLPTGTGLVVVNAARSGATMHTTVTRSVAGTTDEIDVTNGDAVSGNPTIGIADNVNLPGTGAVLIPSGTTAQEPAGVAGELRYNSDTNQFRMRRSGGWEDIGTSGGDPDQNLFATFTPDSGGNIVADAVADTLTLTGGEGITTVGTPGTDTISVDMDISGLTNEDPDTDADEFVFDNGTNHRAVGFLTMSEKIFAKQKVVKASVEAATTANITLSGEQTIDGVLTSASRVLVKDQSTASQNGVYDTAAGAWTRASDFDGNDEAELGQAVLVEAGTVNSGRFFYTSTAPATVGTNDWNWSQGGGGNINVFETFTPDSGGNVVADSENDTLTLAGGTGIATVGTPGTDTVTFDLDINALTTDTPAGGDFVAFADITESNTPNKVTVDNLMAVASNQAFGTITPDSGTSPVADSGSDTLAIAGGEGIATAGDSGTDTLTINLDISNMTSLGAAPATGDLLAVYDLNNTDHREMSIAELFTSPALTGDPTAPTPAQADNDTSIATTAFVRAVRLDQFAAPTATVDINNQLLNNVATPTADAHAATKGYVDSLAQGLDVKQSVVCNSDNTSNEGTGYSYSNTGGASSRGQITWSSGPTTIDGVTLTNGDRILNTETGAAGGVYTRTSATVWDRATDFDEDDEVTAGAFCFVEEGTNYADSGWVLTTNDPITIGGASGTSLSWAQFSGAGQITDGAALLKTGNTLDVQVDGTTIEVNSDALRVKAGTANQVLRTNSGGTLAEWGAIDLSAGAAVSGVLDETNGGTGQSTIATGDILYGTGANVLSKLAVGAAGNMIHVNSGGTNIEYTTNIDGGTF